MATSRSWRPSQVIDGPHIARLDDIEELNVVFSEAFTERYRRDGMVGVRVPNLNPLHTINSTCAKNVDQLILRQRFDISQRFAGGLA